MAKKRRNAVDKLNTLFFGKDLRVTEGEPYTEIREYDFSTYYPEEKYITPVKSPTENIFDIRDYGASVDNDDNAEFINKAIEAAAQVNGVVLVDGGDYVSTTVMLKSNITLFIACGSSVSANTTGKGYEKHRAILFAENEKNITLTGGGKIKGNGHLFGRKPVADKNNTTPANYIDVIEMRQDYRSQLRFAHPSKYGGPVEFKCCENIAVDNIIIENSAYWTFKLTECRNVIVKNFIINNNRNVANADGIDITSGSDIDISHCFISTADDGIVLKNALWLGSKGEMKNISITDCEVISRTNAFKIGTETTYDISNIRVTDCSFFMTDVYPGSVSGISIEACDGSVVSNVSIENIKMNRCTCPIFIRVGNRNRAKKINTQSANAIEFGVKASKGGTTPKKLFDGKSRVRDIRISNVVADEVEIPVIIAGYRQGFKINCIENVELNNITINYADIPETTDRRLFIPEYVTVYPEGWRFRNLPAYAVWCRHVRNICLNNFTCNHPQKSYKKEFVFKDTSK